jgi:hypothetical protein
VTEIDGDTVKVSWSLSTNNGTPITQYKVYLKENDSDTYTQESVDCVGTDATVISNKYCNINSSTFSVAPYNIGGGDSIWAKVIAVNLYGETQ